MDEKRIDLIEKLLRKAERAGTQEEAETFYAKAQELMSKWAIDEAMLNVNSDEARQQIVAEWIEVNKSGFWKSNCQLMFLIAKANDVQAIRIEPFTPTKAERERGYRLRKPKMHLIGYSSDVEHVKMMYASMRVQITRAGNSVIPEYVRSDTREAFVWRRSFLEAFAGRIYERMMESKQAARRAAEKEYGSNSLALVLVSKSDLVRSEFERIYPDARPINRRSQMVNAHGANEGRKAADRADVGNKQASSGTKGELV